MPRDLQERAQRVAREADRLTGELGRAPTHAELADSLASSVEDVLEAREAFAGFEAGSLDARVDLDDEGSDSLGDVLGSIDRGYELVEARASVLPALAALPERDRMALQLRFEEGMTQSEIGRALGISQMQVSRILRRALTTMRAAV